MQLSPTGGPAVFSPKGEAAAIRLQFEVVIFCERWLARANRKIAKKMPRKTVAGRSTEGAMQIKRIATNRTIAAIRFSKGILHRFSQDEMARWPAPHCTVR